jgi:polar amino acid transport system substrate-binding protein
MKRLLVVVCTLGLVAAALTTWSAAAPSVGASPQSAAKTKLPPLPANIKQRGRWNIGVKCDVPPFGYIDVQGKNQGFDVEIGRMFARYAFGRAQRVTFVCAPTAAREPLITSGRVDLVISTFSYSADRATRIDFSEPYYNAGGRLLVKNNGPVQKLADIKGRNIATTSGSVYDRWMKNCFPGTNVITTDTFTNAKLTLDQGRADAVMFDDAVLLPVAAADPNTKITDDTFLASPYGIGMRKGNTELKAWVDSRLELMRKKDQFLPILKANVPPRFLASFSKNILRPNQTFQYPAPGAPSVDTVCQ